MSQLRYKLLGNSGLRVSELCLGTMTFGEDWDFGAHKDESRKMWDAFGAAGGNFIDTANVYTNGTSEKIVGEFLQGEREKWVVATKYTANLNPTDPNAGGNARKNLHQSVEASLKRLNTDYIDLLWVHAWDFMTPVEELMRSLDDLVRQGKILYAGISDAPAWIVSQANTLAMLRGWSPFVGLQIEYSLIERTPERDLIPMARAHNIAVTPWSPLASGILTGKYNREKTEGEVRRMDAGMMSAFGAPTEVKLAIAQEVVNIAQEIGRSPAQVALRWLLEQADKGGTSAVPVIPILGGRKSSQIEDNLQSVDFRLETAQMERLNKVSAIELGFPHDFLASPFVVQFVNGQTRDRTDNPRDPRS